MGLLCTTLSDMIKVGVGEENSGEYQGEYQGE